ncbi:MAG: L-threonylcarbamoyladenylate synthase [bacterium]
MKDIVSIIDEGGIGVLPTDTILGLVGSAFSKKAVEKIYNVRQRDKDKPLIILIENSNDLKNFGVKDIPVAALEKIWPDKVSIIFEIHNKKLKYLDRGTKSLCFRMPKDRSLRDILKRTGPLVAPSANIQGMTPAKNITEAKKYFGDKIDFYLSGKTKSIKPSTILRYLPQEKLFKLEREGGINENRLRSKILLK